MIPAFLRNLFFTKKKPKPNNVDYRLSDALLSLFVYKTNPIIAEVLIKPNLYNLHAISRRQLNKYLDTIYYRLTEEVGIDLEIEDTYIEVRRGLVGFIMFKIIYTTPADISKYKTISNYIYSLIDDNTLPKLNYFVRSFMAMLHMYSNKVEYLNKTTKQFLTVLYVVRMIFKKKDVLDVPPEMEAQDAIAYLIFFTSKFYFNSDCKEEYKKYLSIIENQRTNHIDNINTCLYDTVFIKMAKAVSTIGTYSLSDLLYETGYRYDFPLHEIKTVLKEINTYNVYTNAITIFNNVEEIDKKLNHVDSFSVLEDGYKVDNNSIVKNSPYTKFFNIDSYKKLLLDMKNDVEIVVDDQFDAREYLLYYLKINNKSSYGVVDIRTDALNLSLTNLIKICKDRYKLDNIYLLITSFNNEFKTAGLILSSFFRKLDTLRHSKEDNIFKNVKIILLNNKSNKTKYFSFPNVINLSKPNILDFISNDLNILPEDVTLKQYIGIEKRMLEIYKYRNTNINLYREKVLDICKDYNIPEPEDNNENLEKDSYYSTEYLNIKDNDVKDIISKTKKYVKRKDFTNLSFLLYGKSGTGKSMFATELAETLGFELKTLSASSFLSKWVGETEERIANIFTTNDKNTIILVDEAEALFTNRENVSSNHEAQMVNEFLIRLERFKGILILTTNNINNFDKAFLRRILLKLEFLPIHKDKISKLINNIITSEKLKDDYDLTNINNELENLTLGMIGVVLKQKTFFNFNSTKILVDKLKEELNVTTTKNKVGFSI